MELREQGRAVQAKQTDLVGSRSKAGKTETEVKYSCMADRSRQTDLMARGAKENSSRG